MNEGQMPQDWEVPFAKLSSQVDAVGEDTRRILRHLEGNGQPGLITRVERADIAVKDLQGQQKGGEDDRRWLWRTVIGAAIVAVVGALFALTGRATP